MANTQLSQQKSRDSSYENTGISFQNCSISATNDLYSNSSTVKSYLGRPWKEYSRTVYLNSYIGKFIDPAGWIQWSNGDDNDDDNDDQELDTLYFGEYENHGPGSSTDDRVTWEGYHKMNKEDTYNFTVSEFINSDEYMVEFHFISIP